MATLNELLTPRTAEAIKQALISSLQGRGFPTTDWTSTSLERALVEMEASSLYDLAAQLVPSIAAGGLLLEALDKGLSGWITLLAKNNYSLDRFPATKTQGTVKLQAGVGAGPYTIVPGQLVAASNAGRRYTNITGGTLNPAGTLNLTFEAEEAGSSYNDPNGTVGTLLTPLPGVICSNPAPSDYTTPILTGSSTGTITPSGGSPSPGTYQIRIDVSGQKFPGTAQWSWRRAGGAWNSVGNVASAALGANGITVTLNNGTGNPSFIQGNIWTFSSPASWITQQGTDEESDNSLVARCLSRWPSLSAIPLEDKYVTWAKQVAPGVVTKIRAEASPSQSAVVNITVAGDAGVIDPAVVAAIQAYIDVRCGLTDLPVVASATGTALTPSGAIIYVTGAQLNTAKVAAQAALLEYVKAAPIGGYRGLGIGQGIIPISEIVGLITNVPGVQKMDYSNFDIGQGVGLDLLLGPTNVTTYTDNIASAVTWVSV